jgi:hypothetical protein
MFENKVVKLAIAYLLIMFIGFIYNKYKKTIDIQEQYDDGELIQKYLLNESSITKTTNRFCGFILNSIRMRGRGRVSVQERAKI